MLCLPKCVVGWLGVLGLCAQCVHACLVLALLPCTHHHAPSTPPFLSPPHPSALLSPSPPSLHYALHWYVDDLARYQNGQLSNIGLFGLLWALPSLPLTPPTLSDILHSCASRHSAQPICPFPNSGRALLLVVAGVQCEPLCG